MKQISLFCLVVLMAVAQADIYKQVDSSGRTTYSNIPMKGAIRISSDPEVRKPASKSKPLNSLKNTNTHHANINKTNVSFPEATTGPLNNRDLGRIVDAATQKTRDNQRARILLSELKTEVALQQETQNRLAVERTNNKPDAEKIRRLADNMHVHQNNIQALQTEINRMK